jgi:hypothetical protein
MMERRCILGSPGVFSSIRVITECHHLGEKPIAYGRDIMEACNSQRAVSFITPL